MAPLLSNPAMRPLLALVVVLLAGCASEPTYAPLAPPGDGSAAEQPPLPPFGLAGCQRLTATIAVPDGAFEMPEGVRPQPFAPGSPLWSLVLDVLQCDHASGAAPDVPTAMLLFGLAVDVDEDLDAQGEEILLLAVLTVSPELEAWFAGLGLETEDIPVTLEQQEVLDATHARATFDELILDAVTTSTAASPTLHHRHLVAPDGVVTGVMEAVAQQLSDSTGPASLVIQGGAEPPFASTASFSIADTWQATWTPTASKPAPNP